MKTVLEQLMEINAKLAELETAVMGVGTSEFEPCCDDECECGCDESPVEVDGAPDSQYIVTTEVDPQDAIVRAQTITFTYDELIDFATRLTRRAVDTCKEAVELASFSDDEICDVSLNWDRAIEVEIDNDRIHRDIVEEIEGAVDFEESSVDDEVRSVLGDMHLDNIS